MSGQFSPGTLPLGGEILRGRCPGERGGRAADVQAFVQGLERGNPGAAFDTGTLAADVEWQTSDLMGAETFGAVRGSSSSCADGLRTSRAIEFSWSG